MGKYETELAKLNAEQRQAVETIEGPLLVIAGPGTGKTQLLSMRVARILHSTDVSPANILCLTFTEAAARNMRERLTSLIGDAAQHVGIYTFHGFGSDIIQRYPEYFLDQPLLQPIDELGSFEILSTIFKKLPHSNPLHQRLGDDFLHLRSTQTAISWFKQAGLAPDDLKALAKANEAFIRYIEAAVEQSFVEPTSAKQLPVYQNLLKTAESFQQKGIETTLASLFTAELTVAIEQVDASKRYAPSMTAWRNKWLVQNQLKKWVLADQRKTKFLQAVAKVYDSYQKALAAQGLYSYDDMIMRTAQALVDHEELRLTLQEQYQYVMVDEYQDTNGAQNRLLELLADSPVHESQPNLMVVGDDDQGIYRFQGAELSIMVDFLQRWRNVKQVVLTNNYRSGQPLLDFFRQVIVQGEDRLENRVANISKALSAAMQPKPKVTIANQQAASELEQYAFVADDIARRLKAGQKPGQIAILAPKHSFLRDLVPFLLDRGIPVNYERREHILSQPHIVELLNLSRLVQAAAEQNWPQLNALLPVVLAADYWQIPATELWQLGIKAHTNKQSWYQTMQHSTNPTVKAFAKALPALSQQALTKSLDTMLDLLIGNQPAEPDGQWSIPYRNFYFSQKRLEQQAQNYFTLLGQLTTLRGRLRDFRPDQPQSLKSLLDFVNLYEQSSLNLLDTNPHATHAEAVELMTAYKAKGLEWPTVYVLAIHNDVWGTRVRSSNYSFGLPSNLTWVKPARDSADDRLRLLYVALSRVRNELILTSYQRTLAGQQTELVSWLRADGVGLPPAQKVATAPTKDLIRNQELHWGLTTPEQRSLADSLRTFLSTYQLSATHFNSFFDFPRGGPKHFFYQHVLHFPEALTPASVYGSAIHETIHYMHSQYNRSRVLPKLATVQKLFSSQLMGSSLPEDDKLRLAERGQIALQNFYGVAKQQFLPTDKSEYNFAKEGAKLDSARLTGKIDVLRQIAPGKLAIIDYKTGSAMMNWRPKGAYAQIRAHLYQQQLGFYHFLVRGSAHFNKQSVADLSLLFVEPDESGQLQHLSYQPSTDDLERLEKLVGVVWQHIMELNFPDISSYSLDLKGLKQFEDDLINGAV